MNDDAELLSKAREGDERAFAELVTRYQHIAWSVCMRITENQHDAEDALQHSLASTWKNLSRFRGESKFGLVLPHRQQRGRSVSAQTQARKTH